MLTVFYIAFTCFGAIILPYSGGLHKSLFKTYNNKTGRNKRRYFDVLLTVHLSILISVINQLDAQNFCFAISNKLIAKQKFFASVWLITEVNVGMLWYQ